MKKITFIGALLLAGSLQAQTKISKPPLDTSILGKFPELLPATISNDGRYVSYAIKQPKAKDILVVQSTDQNWKKEFVAATSITFSDDSKQFVFKSMDTLFF